MDAKGVGYSYSMLGRMETGKQKPTMEGAKLLDQVLDAGGVLIQLAAAARAEPYAGLPPATPHFVGRETALAELTKALIDDAAADRSTVAFVVGPPGVGKTALLRRWANSHQEQFDAVLYADLHGFGPRAPAETGDILEALLRGLGVRDRLPTADDLRLALLQGHLQALDRAGQRVLIVLDNARNSRQVSAVLPGSRNVSILISSRVRLAGLVISANAPAIPLAFMAKPDAVALIRSYLGDERVDAEPDAVTRLANLCGTLPLALTIAAEQVAANERLTIQQHAERLADRALELQIEDDEDTGVRAAFSFSYGQLSPDLSRVFRLCGLHPGQEFSAASVGALTGLPEAEANRLLEQLVEFSLVEQVALHTFRLHDLLRVYAAEEASREEWAEERRIAIDRVVHWYLYASNAASWLITPERPDHHIVLPAPPDNVEPPVFESFSKAYDWFRQELPTIAGIAELALHNDLLFAAWRIPVECFDFYIHHRPLGAWIDGHECAYTAAERAGEPLQIAQAAEELAEGYLRRGSPQDLDRAWKLNERTIEVCEGLAPNRFVAFAYVEMGNIQFERGRYEESAQLCEQAVRAAQAAGAFIGETLSRTHLGAAYRELALFDRAIEHGTRAFDMLVEADDQHGVAFAAVPLARTHRLAGNIDVALRYCEQAQESYTATSDPQGYAEALGEKALTLAQRGEVADATFVFRSALFRLRELDLRKAAALEADWYKLVPEG
ncbi:ATP-binding protein [Amycolatopsis roodepoortensis]|uniref:ATP-binding protein n=1 Tax=Amycolatopsis roodepoortensis TaxID=700274 RepID=UPI00214BE093|nr:ATP-binding protein [Amycolatopsis roodepoortensis]UUV32064.1 ATP-binding protein [Amycolatopsis roodepoortensis]